MTIRKGELALWVAISLLALVLLVVAAILFGEIAEIQRTLDVLAGTGPASERSGEAPWWGAGTEPPPTASRCWPSGKIRTTRKKPKRN